MSSPSTQSPRAQTGPGDEDPRTHTDSNSEIARLKRRLAVSQEEIKELTEGKTKKPPYADLI